MLDSDELIKMEKAYRKLYEIETSLRNIISMIMLEHYGVNWYQTAHCHVKRKPPKKPFDRIDFHELENFLRIYPCFSDLQCLVNSLRKLYSIRNHIAHCRQLSEKQSLLLETEHHFIMSKIKN